MRTRGLLKPPRWPASDAGIYCLLLELPRPLTVKAGRLDGVRVEAGLVLYVGRARRNLFARLARHMRRRKPRRWHIDYLFPHATSLGAFVFAGGSLTECGVADRLSRRADLRRIIPGFGASDCRCPGHLLWLGSPATARRPGGAARATGNPPFHLAGASFFAASRAMWTSDPVPMKIISGLPSDDSHRVYPPL